jgi:HSP20 family protein
MSAFDPFSMLDTMGSRVGAGEDWQARARSFAAMDVYRKTDALIVELDVPGGDASSIDIAVEGDLLSISGEVSAGHDEVDELFVCERPHVRFRRQVYLDERLDTENIRADLRHGVLTIRVPVVGQGRGRKIAVSGGRQQSGRDAVGDVDHDLRAQSSPSPNSRRSTPAARW